ncbi:Protein of unknown function [Anaerovibrio lipolyticus DSM 3074]|uniref:DUF4127 domain-containing protein n=3 Tax=Anaerovibrio lipolyticus TaxID=82374 RepID=A0A0B2JUG5_9FIRM|nr:DUF4127 family protein [Anaerovibrio lipolyticus]KHM51299.1 hypothetical protein NZ47_11165 [Anaerovibrio lipolyticus]SHI49143.1 Protein of unknown function [Anaerovibrio lipolyticus DSM 3074]
MKRYIPIFLIIICFLLGSGFLMSQKQQGEIIDQMPATTKKILLVPLDSRPPCGQLVADNGRTAGIEIILPPSETMDFYTLPGDTSKMRKWLYDEIKNCDEAIISIDQLLYGGLIASRNKTIKDEDITALAEYLKKLHGDNPNIKIHAFSILPRMNPPDFVEKYQDRKKLMEWSRLVHKYDDNPLSETAEKIQVLEREIPSEQIKAYIEIYNRNLRLNCLLANLVADGTLEDLSFGQDDGEVYSLPNLKLKEFMHYLHKNQIAKDKLAIVHGADEVALSILTNIISRSNSFKVYVDYSSEKAAIKVMPYMAICNQDTANERLNFHHDIIVSTPEEADYILFISATDEETMDRRRYNAEKLLDYQQRGKPVALVDLSKSFIAQEALLPILLKENFPVNSLIAYAGWNTASNSIGTAVSQAEIYLTALNQGLEQDRVVYSNLNNLNNRICEDYYYLKDVIDLVNINLKKKGYSNVYDLDLEHNYKWAVDMMEAAMNQRLVQYKTSDAFTKSFWLQNTEYAVTDMQISSYFPWPRTFEINLKTSPTLRKK